jgi:cystathionine beta-synthase
MPIALHPPKVVDSVVDLIANTPMVRAHHLDTGPCTLFLKMDNHNPGGSIKDRPALFMIEAAEREGLLQPGGTIIEATAGNTGLGLAMVGLSKGYRVKIVVPDKMSQEKIYHLRALGAEVIMTRSDVGKGHPEYYHDVAEALVKETPGAFYVNQFENTANVDSHYATTGPEIYEQMEGQIDAFVAGVGTGGTLTGVGRFLKERNPNCRIVLADPEGSILADLVNTGRMPDEVGSWVIEGIGEDFVPSILDVSIADEAIAISDRDSLHAARTLLRREGILAGSSVGTLLAATLEWCRRQTEPKRVCTLVCDSGNKYLSKQFNDYWMLEQGFMDREPRGDLGDLVMRRAEEGAAITLDADMPLRQANKLMKLYDISQLPITENDKIVGILDESDLLVAIRDRAKFDAPVRDYMTPNPETVPIDGKIEDLMEIFDRDHIALVMDGDRFYGVITRLDLANHLRRTMETSL